MSTQSRISKRAILYGNVDIGEGTVVEDNVILGSPAGGKLSIGKNSIIRSGSVIYSFVKIGDNFRSGHNILIRENTEIGDSVLIGTNSVVENNCKIGNNVSVQTNVYITTNTILEDKVFMGPCSVTTNDKYMVYGAELRGPIIKRGAKVGANATILPGIVVGEDAVIGSGSVVTKNVPTGITVIGNPGKAMIRKS